MSCHSRGLSECPAVSADIGIGIQRGLRIPQCFSWPKTITHEVASPDQLSDFARRTGCTVSVRPNAPQDSGCDALTVMFDGSCPLCRREIGMYQSLAPLQQVSWLDVSQDTEGLSSAEQARYMARFHVRLPNGQLQSGARAFVALWLVLPGWRWLGRVARLPGMTALLALAYAGFLHLRPILQRWAKRAETKLPRHL